MVFEEIFQTFTLNIIDAQVVRSEKLSHKNAIKHEKGDPPRFSDNPKYPPLIRIWAKPQGPPLWISNYCASMHARCWGLKTGLRKIPELLEDERKV